MINNVKLPAILGILIVIALAAHEKIYASTGLEVVRVNEHCDWYDQSRKAALSDSALDYYLYRPTNKFDSTNDDDHTTSYTVTSGKATCGNAPYLVMQAVYNKEEKVVKYRTVF